MIWDDHSMTSGDQLTPPRGLEGFQPRWTRDGRYWFFEQDRWQLFAQPKGGAPHDPPFKVTRQPDRDYVTIQESPEGLDGFVWLRSGTSDRTYWYKQIGGWHVFAEPPYPHTSPAPRVWAPPFRLEEPAMSLPLTMGDGALNYGLIPTFQSQPSGFVTNDTELGRIAMGGQSTATASPWSGWFGRDLVIKDPTLIGGAMTVVVALAFLAGRIRRGT